MCDKRVIMFDKFDYFNRGYIFGVKTDKYKPYINYSWSQTLTVEGNQHIKDTGTAGLNLQQYFGQGCWFNGIDQGISTDVKVSGASWSFALRYRAGRVLTESALSQFITNNTGRFRIKTEDNGTRFNVQLGSYQINALLDTTAQSRDIYISYIGTILSLYSDGSFIESVDTLTPQVISVTNIEIGKSKVYYFNGIVKDVYAFNRVLTQTEIEKYTKQPNQFFMDSLDDSSCVLAMPMCEKDGFVRNYKNNADYPITNYLATCRTNAQRLPYGLQTSGFKRDSNGLILGKSYFFESDGVGYGNTGWVPKWNEDFTVETVLEILNDSEFRLNGNSFNNGIYFGKNSGGKSLYVRVFGSTVIPIANTKDIVCLIFSYNWQTKEVKQYLDGVLVDTQLATHTTNALLPVILGMASVTGTYPVIKPVRLFKTHSKVLTQEEITKNFNKYQAQGLLDE